MPRPVQTIGACRSRLGHGTEHAGQAGLRRTAHGGLTATDKELIAQILDMEPTEDLFDAKVKVLSELIDHHVQEEEGEMFPKARKAGLDLEQLGQHIAERKPVIAI